jgi:hypothetical protein
LFVFYAEKNRLYVMEKELITSGSANIYPVRFEFSPDWDGLERTAIFQAGCRKKAVPIVDGVCSVPAEVLSDPGRYLMMGVCGKQGESVVLPTVWANLGWIVEGAVPGGNPLPEDWQEALDSKGDTLAYTEEGELGLYSGDKLLSSVPIEGGGGEGVPGPQGEPGADATINGVNTLELEAGENIVLDQQGNRLTISSTGGVTHAELEEAMSGKQDVITSGDGLEKEGSTLRVSSPVQGVISQEAYDALPEEEQNKGLYIVSGQRPGMRIYADGTMVEVLGERGPAGPDGSPIGTVISFMGSTAPEDYLVCDGGVHNIAEYPDLAEFFREQFGSASHFGGDGETTFAVPTVQGTETGMLSCIKARKSAAAEDVYSLEERIVERWIDGRPVYRKTVIIDRFSSNSGNMYTVPDIYNVDRVINYSSSYTSAGYRNYMNLHVKVVDGRIYTSQGVSSSVIVATDFVGTFDYVKTTDQPTIPLPEAEANVPQEDWPDVAEDEIVSEEI